MVDQLRSFYEERGRPEAVRNLSAALERVAEKIGRDPSLGRSAPRPYPELARAGRAWIKEGPYWIAYSTATPPTIVGVFHDTANIPRRA